MSVLKTVFKVIVIVVMLFMCGFMIHRCPKMVMEWMMNFTMSGGVR